MAIFREMVKLNCSYGAIGLELGHPPDTIRNWVQRLGWKKESVTNAIPYEKRLQVLDLLEQGFPLAHITRKTGVPRATAGRIGSPTIRDTPPPEPPFPCDDHGTPREWARHARGWRANCKLCNALHKDRKETSKRTIDHAKDPEEMWVELLKGRRFPDRLARRRTVYEQR